MPTRLKAYIALLINVSIWGAALPIVKPALSFVTPYQYLFFRYLIAAPISLPFLIYLMKKHKPSIKVLRNTVLLEFIGVTGYLSLLYEGLSRTTSIEATLIANTASIFIILGGIFFLKEQEERHELIGLIMAIAGALLLTFEPIITGRNHLGLSSLTGNLLVLAANLFWASYILLAKKRYRNTPKLLVGFLSPWVGLMSFFILVLLTTPDLSVAGVGSMITSSLSIIQVASAAIYMSLLGSIIAVPAYIYGNDLIEASEASLFSYLQPVIAIPLATIWLKEPINIIMILALLLTTSGVYTAERRKKTIATAKSVAIHPTEE